MRAAVRGPEDGSLQIVDREPPQRGARVVAAAINPVDMAIAGGKLPFRVVPADGILGFEGVAEDGDGLVYFSAPATPWGSYAEQVDLGSAETVAIPAGVDPTVAAAVGVPGIAAYLALTKAGGFREGCRVLVLGAGGSVGSLAVQIAVALGASRVVGAVRTDDEAAAVEALGAHGVRTDDLDAFDADLATYAGDGFDVVVDTIWGEAVGVSLRHLAEGARWAQVGNSAAASATIAAPDFRNRGALLVGHSNFLASPEERSRAYAAVVGLVASGKVQASARPIGLDELPAEWEAISSGAGRGKAVVTP